MLEYLAVFLARRAFTSIKTDDLMFYISRRELTLLSKGVNALVCLQNNCVMQRYKLILRL
jgi:hypothetical protein